MSLLVAGYAKSGVTGQKTVMPVYRFDSFYLVSPVSFAPSETKTWSFYIPPRVDIRGAPVASPDLIATRLLVTVQAPNGATVTVMTGGVPYTVSSFSVTGLGASQVHIVIDRSIQISIQNTYSSAQNIGWSIVGI